MIDSANSVLQGIVNQMEYTYDEPDGTVIATTNPEIADAYNTVVERAVPNSAYSGQWSDDWNASMTNGEFATMLCPGWMHGIISGIAPDVTGWNIANVFPERRRQLGRFVPDRPRQRQERRRRAGARRLAVGSRAAGRGVPERRRLPEPGRGVRQPRSDRLTPNAYFNDAPTGQIDADRAEAVTVLPYKSANYFKYHDALQNAVNRVFDGTEDQTTSWNTWVAEVEAF